MPTICGIRLPFSRRAKQSQVTPGANEPKSTSEQPPTAASSAVPAVVEPIPSRLADGACNCSEKKPKPAKQPVSEKKAAQQSSADRTRRTESKSGQASSYNTGMDPNLLMATVYNPIYADTTGCDDQTRHHHHDSGSGGGGGGYSYSGGGGSGGYSGGGGGDSGGYSGGGDSGGGSSSW